MSKLQVAVLQLTSTDDIDSNLMMIEALLEQVPDGTRLICLPENCLYMRLNEGEEIESIPLSHFAIERLCEYARKKNYYIHLGSVPVLLPDGHMYNSSVLIRPDGIAEASYQKLHLFDIQLEGQKPLRESDRFRHGQQTSSFDVDGWRIGESICYDVRFSELYSIYAREEVDLILIPAAFLVKTGQAHWEILLRARAIESQAFVIAAAQTGIHQGAHGGYRETFGHSMIVHPWGQIIELKKEGVGLLVATLHKDEAHRVRSQIPMKYHRRIPTGSLK